MKKRHISIFNSNMWTCQLLVVWLTSVDSPWIFKSYLFCLLQIIFSDSLDKLSTGSMMMNVLENFCFLIEKFLNIT